MIAIAETGPTPLDYHVFCLDLVFYSIVKAVIEDVTSDLTNR